MTHLDGGAFSGSPSRAGQIGSPTPKWHCVKNSQHPGLIGPYRLARVRSISHSPRKRPDKSSPKDAKVTKIRTCEASVPFFRFIIAVRRSNPRYRPKLLVCRIKILCFLRLLLFNCFFYRLALVRSIIQRMSGLFDWVERFTLPFLTGVRASSQ